MSSEYKMRSSRQLSRLSLTGNIHEHTPVCVLIEVADAHGIRYEQKDIYKPNFSSQILSSIHQTSVPTIHGTSDLVEWQYIARFVNKHVQWPQSKLTQAYNFLTGFTNTDDPLSKIPMDFVHGLQTPTNPLSINACILYKVCVHHRLNFNSRTTIEQMSYSVKMLRETVDSVMRRVAQFIERDAKRTDLINILMLSPHEIKDPDPMIMDTKVSPDVIPKAVSTYEMLQVLHTSLNDIRTLQQKIDPTTDSGSIALAAIIFGIDISRSVHPTREYRILRISGRNNYKPSDHWMQYWYIRNSAIFDLYTTFNPLFSVDYYENNRMIAMLSNEGYTSSDLNTNNPYELLQMNYVAETFYMGEMPNMKSKSTLITLEEIGDIPYGELLCFGQYDGPLQAVSMSELTDLFNSNQNFTNPFQQNSVFTSNSIGKLKTIASSPNGPVSNIRLSLETVQVRNNLLEAIAGVELITKNNDEPTRQFSFSYRNSSPNTKEAIRNTLTKLLHAGMYMRGWSGTAEYPVIRAPVPPEREPEVAVNVTKAIAEYDTSIRSLGKLGLQINNLPLVTYKDGHYQISNSNSDGLTIGERINIIKQGDDTNNVASCIRLSSNWLCASAHKYISALGLISPFDIFNLRHIS